METNARTKRRREKKLKSNRKEASTKRHKAMADTTPVAKKKSKKKHVSVPKLTIGEASGKDHGNESCDNADDESSTGTNTTPSREIGNNADGDNAMDDRDRLKMMEQRIRELEGLVKTPRKKRKRKSKSGGDDGGGKEDSSKPWEDFPLMMLFNNTKAIKASIAGQLAKYVLFCYIENYAAARPWVEVDEEPEEGEQKKEQEPFTTTRATCKGNVAKISGMCMSMFAVSQREGARKIYFLEGELGKLWSSWISHTIYAHSRKARYTHFASSNNKFDEDGEALPEVPRWYRNKNKGGTEVEDKLNHLWTETNAYLTKQNPIDGSPTHVSTTSENHLTLETERSYFVRMLVSKIRTLLTTGRGEVWKRFFKRIMFVVVEIERPNGNKHGLGIKLTNDIYKFPVTDFKNSIWDVADAVVKGKKRDEKNKAILDKLKKDFPGMEAWIQYPILIERPASRDEADVKKYKELAKAQAEASPQTAHDGDAYFDKQERINFIDLAREMLTGLCGLKWDAVAASSPYTFKAVLILALGLRGLISQLVNGTASEAESKAFEGTQTGPIAETNRSLTTILLGGNGMLKRHKNDTILQESQGDTDERSVTWKNNRLSARRISYEDYLIAKAALDKEIADAGAKESGNNTETRSQRAESVEEDIESDAEDAANKGF